MEKEKPN